MHLVVSRNEYDLVHFWLAKLNSLNIAEFQMEFHSLEVNQIEKPAISANQHPLPESLLLFVCKRADVVGEQDNFILELATLDLVEGSVSMR